MINKHIKEEKRSVLLFIPKLNDYMEHDVKLKISMLRRSVNFSVNQVSDILSNRLFEEFSVLNKCFYERGLPQIDVQTTEDDTINSESNIRVCLTKFNDFDFYNKKDITLEKIQENNISHLIELHISEKSKKISWKKSQRVDNKGNIVFDVAVTTPLASLYKVIISIMVDIYCYYIVGLSSKYEDRCSYSLKKVRYLSESYSKNKLKTSYNINNYDLMNNISYLPISMLYDPSSKNLCLQNTIVEYLKIIKEILIYEFNDQFPDYSKIMDELEKMDKNDADNVYYIKSKDFDKHAIKEIRSKVENISNSSDSVNIKFLHNRCDEPIEFFCFSDIDDILPLYPYFEWYKIVIDRD